MADARAKGRHSHGEEHSGVLTDAKVKDIRARYEPRKVSFRALAAEFGVATSTIQGIIEGKTWKHLL